MIKGTGSLLSEEDENGISIPFLTTDEILKQISKFGFLVEYDLKSNLPDQVTAYLSMLYNLGYDKINRLYIKTRNKDGVPIARDTVVVLKSCEETIDIMKYEKYVLESEFNKLLDLNVVMNVTNEPDMVWDWLTYMCNIKDVLEENIDQTDDFETKTDVKDGEDVIPPPPPFDPISIVPEGYSVYTGEDEEEDDGE